MTQNLPTRVIQMERYIRQISSCVCSDMAINEDVASWFSFIALFKILLDIVFFFASPIYTFYVNERLTARREAQLQEEERQRRAREIEPSEWDTVRLPEARHV
jgi:hypothetical protein